MTIRTAADYPQIFDAFAHVKSDLRSEEAKIEALDETERKIFFACLAAVKAADAGQQRVFNARRSVRELQAAYDDSVKAYEIAHPTQRTQGDEMRATSAANRPGYKPSTDDGTARVKTLAKKVAALETKYADLNAEDDPNREAIEKAAASLVRARAALAADPVAVTAAMVAANEAVARALAEINQATTAQAGLELVSGNSIDAWRRCIPQISATDIHRKMCRDEAERKIAIANGTAPAPVAPEPPVLCELEKVMIAKGKVKNEMRGRTYFGPR